MGTMTKPKAIAIGENADLILTKSHHTTGLYERQDWFNFSLVYAGNLEYSDSNVVTEIPPKRIYLTKEEAVQLKDALTVFLQEEDKSDG